MTNSADDSNNAGATPPPKTDDVYDRQIRLWGAEAQAKINKAKVLYIHITGVSAEVLKNLVLAGVRADICDGRPYPEAVADTPTSFFPPGELVTASSSTENDDAASTKKARGQCVAQAIHPHVEELNPLLGSCHVENKLVQDLPDEFFAQYDIIIASRLGMKQASRIASVTTMAGGKFYLVDCFGWWGTAVMDLGPEHTFRKELGKDKLSDVTKLGTYVSLTDLFQVKIGDATDRFHKTPPAVWMRYRAILEYQARANMWPSANMAQDFTDYTKSWLSKESPALLEQECMNNDELLQLASLATAQVPPVCAVLGGVLGNEVIKAISGKGEPANNTLLFDGMTGGCQAFLVK